MKSFLLAAAALAVEALNNGVGLTPPMGVSSWLAFSSNVSSAGMRQTVAILQQRGLGAKGYHFVNVDEGWFKGRDNNGNMVEDFVKCVSVVVHSMFSDLLLKCALASLQVPGRYERLWHLVKGSRSYAWLRCLFQVRVIHLPWHMSSE